MEILNSPLGLYCAVMYIFGITFHLKLALELNDNKIMSILGFLGSPVTIPAMLGMYFAEKVLEEK